MKEKIRLNANALKVIAIIAMTIDHFTDIFYPGFPLIKMHNCSCFLRLFSYCFYSTCMVV